jgi:type VI protein secretion system component Hcp
MTVSLILLEIHDKNGLAGDVTIDGYVGHIAIDSFEWNVTAETSERERDAPTTTVRLDQFRLKKQFDAASLTLCQRMESDKPFNVTLRVIDPSTRPKGTPNAPPSMDSVLEIELIGCHIETMSLSVNPSSNAMSVSETVDLSFEDSIVFNYQSYASASRTRTKAMTARIDTPSDENFEKS